MSLLTSPSISSRGFSLKGHLDFIADHLTRDNDAFILIDGYEGAGKSAFSQQQGRYIAKVNDVYVSPEPITQGGNIVYAGQMFEDFMIGVQELPEYSPLWADELIWLAFSRNSRKPDQRRMMQVLATIRDRKFVLFGLLPKKHWADVYIRGHRTQFWWWVHSKPRYDEKGHFYFEKGHADFHVGQESKWEPFIFWNEIATVRFDRPNDNDPFWRKYLERKKEFREIIFEEITKQKLPPIDPGDELLKDRKARRGPKDDDEVED